MQICRTDDIRLADLQQSLGSDPGVYLWRNRNNDKRYVGYTHDNIASRNNKRLKGLNSQGDYNKQMQSDWNDNHVFDLEVLETCHDEQRLPGLEEEWIETFVKLNYEMYNSNKSPGELVVKDPEAVLRRLQSMSSVCPDTDCWLANKVDSHSGYGLIWYDGRNTRRHRLALKAAHPELLLKGKHVRHQCGNKACCNPEHLEPGTQGENMADRSIRFEAWGESRRQSMNGSKTIGV